MFGYAMLLQEFFPEKELHYHSQNGGQFKKSEGVTIWVLTFEKFFEGGYASEPRN